MSTEKVPALDAIAQKNRAAERAERAEMRKEQLEAIEIYHRQIRNQETQIGLLERALRLCLQLPLEEDTKTRIAEIKSAIVNGLHALFVAPIPPKPEAKVESQPNIQAANESSQEEKEAAGE
jgi:hypothetical protein